MRRWHAAKHQHGIERSSESGTLSCGMAMAIVWRVVFGGINSWLRATASTSSFETESGA